MAKSSSQTSSVGEQLGQSTGPLTEGAQLGVIEKRWRWAARDGKQLKPIITEPFLRTRRRTATFIYPE